MSMQPEREKEILRIRREIEKNLHDCLRAFTVTSYAGVKPYEIMCEILDKGSCYSFMVKSIKSYTSAEGASAKFEVEYAHGRYTLRSMMVQVEEKVAQLNDALLSPQMSSLLKIFIIHNFLLDTVEYDYECKENPMRFSYAHSAYGALIKGRSVCQGIANAFKLIMDAAGVECYNIHGFGKGGASSSKWEGHAWNIVRLQNGLYTHIDVTFDLGYSKVDKYKYFIKNAAQMREDHRWKDELYPCATESFNALPELRKEIAVKYRQLCEKGIPDKYLTI